MQTVKPACTFPLRPEADRNACSCNISQLHSSHMTPAFSLPRQKINLAIKGTVPGMGQPLRT